MALEEGHKSPIEQAYPKGTCPLRVNLSRVALESISGKWILLLRVTV